MLPCFHAPDFSRRLARALARLQRTGVHSLGEFL
jgi:hypothetical protein